MYIFVMLNECIYEVRVIIDRNNALVSEFYVRIIKLFAFLRVFNLVVDAEYVISILA
jgi:hypothetical protein